MRGKETTRANKVVRTWGGVRFTLKFAWDLRLGDIYIEGAQRNPVDCMQVHDFDWETDTLTMRDRKQIARDFEDWLLDNGASYIAELPYL